MAALMLGLRQLVALPVSQPVPMETDRESAQFSIKKENELISIKWLFVVFKVLQFKKIYGPIPPAIDYFMGRVHHINTVESSIVTFPFCLKSSQDESYSPRLG